MTVFSPVPKSMLFFFFHPYVYPKGFYFYSPQSSSVNRIKDGGRYITSFKTQLSLAPNIYACIAGQLLPSILYNHLSLLWIIFIYPNLSLPEFKISKQWRPGLSAV